MHYFEICRLHSDLKATVQGQLEAVGWTDGSEHGQGNDTLITKLKEEVESLKEVRLPHSHNQYI